MYCIDRRRIANRICCLLNSARRVSFLHRISDTTIPIWLRNTERSKYTWSALKNRYSRRLRPVSGINQPTGHVPESEMNNSRQHGRRFSQLPVRVILKTLGCSRNKLLVHERTSSTKIGTRAFSECRGRYEAEHHRFVLPVDETRFGKRRSERIWVFVAGAPPSIYNQMR